MNSQNVEILKNEQGVSAIIAILITFFVAIIVGVSVWAYYHYKVIPNLQKNTSSTTEPKNNTNTGGQTASSVSAEDFVNNFINEYKKCTGVETSCRNVMEKYAFSALVFKELGNADWLGLQNTPDLIKVSSVSQQQYEDGSALVVMKATYSGDDINKQFILTQLGNTWRIAAIEPYTPLGQ